MENKKRFIICNQIMTPDGTRLISHRVHDFVEHRQKDGKQFFVDGGNAYLRRGGDPFEIKEESIYSDAPFETIRQHLYRGSHGINGDQPLTWIKLCDMDTDHIENCIKYNEERGIGERYNPFYRKELKFRKNGF